MSRYSVDVLHTKRSGQCSGRLANGEPCAVMTNYTCAECPARLCNRHNAQHQCPRRRITP